MVGRPSTRERRSRGALTRVQALVDDKLLAAPETGKAAALADHELDRRIADRAEMIRLALRDHERAIAQQRRCQKSAVLSAWNFEDGLREEREQTEDLRERVALQGDLETGKNGAEFQQLNTLQAIRRSLQAGMNREKMAREDAERENRGLRKRVQELEARAAQK